MKLKKIKIKRINKNVAMKLRQFKVFDDPIFFHQITSKLILFLLFLALLKSWSSYNKKLLNKFFTNLSIKVYYNLFTKI